MRDIHLSQHKSAVELATEWDRLAVERHRQIAGGQDLSFEHVVVPTAIGLLHSADLTCLLDIGAGTGDFTCRLAKIAKEVIGVEPSSGCVEVARNYCRLANVRFVLGTLEDAASSSELSSVTAAVANMTLMTVPNLRSFIKSLSSTLKTGSRFIATFTHPCFWPKYWNYDSAPWFDYSKEIFIEAPFVISNCRTEFSTTHIHRPLELYMREFEQHDLELREFIEPIPSAEIQKLYPAPWRYPRFIAASWEKRGSSGKC